MLRSFLDLLIVGFASIFRTQMDRTTSIATKVHFFRSKVLLLSLIRTVCSEGFQVGRWMSKHFNGRSFVFNCKGNFAGRYGQLFIFGSKRRLKTLVIPSGEDYEGVQRFANALAATIAGPTAGSQSIGFHHLKKPLVTGNLDQRSFAEVVGTQDSSYSFHHHAQSWVILGGLEPNLWSLSNLSCLKSLIPGAICVMPVVADQPRLVAILDGPQASIPSGIFFEVNRTTIWVAIGRSLSAELLSLLGFRQEEREDAGLANRRSDGAGIQNIYSHLEKPGDKYWPKEMGDGRHVVGRIPSSMLLIF